MSLIQLNHAYAFIGGTIVGRFTGIIPSVLISGILLYVADPSLFTVENMHLSKDVVFNMTKGFIR